MSLLSRLSPRAWMLAPACAIACVLWADGVRLHHVCAVSAVAAKVAPIDPASPTGFVDGKRWLIVPEHNNPTYQWIEETQLMLDRGDWRVRSVSYENAPQGREDHAASPYRWWLIMLAWVDHAFSGVPLGACVERAALFADPLLHLALLVAATVFAARRFGPFCAALLSLGLAGIFPLASAFLPGVATDFGLEQICTLWGILLLLAGTLSGRRAPAWYFAAGVASGCGLWLSAMGQVPIIAGIAAGGVLAACVAREDARAGAANASAPAPWRAWALGGALSSLLAYVVEYFPGHMEWELRVNSPLYGLAWLGMGEMLWRAASWLQGFRPTGRARSLGIWILAAAAVAAVPVAIVRSGSLGFLSDDLLSARLTNLPDGAVAEGLASWAGRSGPSWALLAASAPLLLLIPAAWFLVRPQSGTAHRRAIAIALGPVLASLGFALVRLRWWNTLDVALLALMVAAAAALRTATRPAASRWMGSAVLGAILALGLAQLMPGPESGVIRLTRAEVEGLYERALSHWIADHAGPAGATVLAPPFRTSSLCYYGGLRGLGTQNWENSEGLASTFHIVTSMRPDESLSVVSQCGVTHVVLPSWDTDFDDFATMKLRDPSASFIYALHYTHGGGFRWLRPVPYELAPVAGYEGQSVLVLQVVDDASLPVQQSRFVEYLIEMHEIDQASLAGRSLAPYTADLGSLVARAQLSKAQGDPEAFARLFRSILSSLATGSDRNLPWDRRVSLAVVLAIGRRADLSRAQVRRCIGEATAERIRFLTTESLFHLLVLAHRYAVELPDPDLEALSLRLLPDEVRSQL